MFPLSPAASPGCPLSPPPPPLVGNCNSLLSNSWYAADVSSRSVFATTVRTLVVVLFAVVLVLVVVLVSSWVSRPK